MSFQMEILLRNHNVQLMKENDELREQLAAAKAELAARAQSPGQDLPEPTTIAKEELDVLWQRALSEAVQSHEPFTRYRFADKVIAHERQTIAAYVEQLGIEGFGTLYIAAAIRARGRS